MISDLPSLYLIVGKIVVWGSLSVVGILITAFSLALLVAAWVQIRSITLARRYVRHWDLIKSYVGWKGRKHGLDDDSLNNALVACLNDGVVAYQETSGEGAVKLDAAMKAWCASMKQLRHTPGMDQVFLPLPPEDPDQIKTDTIQKSSHSIVGSMPEGT